MPKTIALPASKPLNFIIDLAVYPFEVMVSIDQTEVQLRRSAARYGLDEAELKQVLEWAPTQRGRAVMCSGNETIIRLKTMPDKAELADTISHEVLHAVTFIMSRIGMPLEEGVSDEAYCYLQGYLVRQIYQKLNAIKNIYSPIV